MTPVRVKWRPIHSDEVDLLDEEVGMFVYVKGSVERCVFRRSEIEIFMN